VRFVALAWWLVLVAILLSPVPPSRPDEWAWILDLCTGRWDNEDPSVLVVFNLMGVWPLVLMTQLRGSLWAKPLPGLPFALGSFALGAYALLPFFILRPAANTDRPLPKIGGLLDHWALPALCLTASMGLLGWFAFAGDPWVYAERAQSEKFLFAMAVDFCTLWTLSTVLAEQAHRDDPSRPSPWWCLIPVAGSALWLVMAARPKR
jgi:hypothetical protein